MSYSGPVSNNQDGTIINYIPYGRIENNTTRGWSACTLTWSGTTPSGAPTLTATQMAISASSSDPLSNLYSLLLTKSAANAQYQGFVSDAFTIKREDLAKVLTGSFYYEVASGTVDMSGTSTQSLEIWVYNVTANQWIQPAGYRGLNQSSGPGLVTFTFQTDSTPANNSYRIAVITQQTEATAYTVKFDTFKLSPQTAPIGPVVTDFQSYTATTSGFNIGTTGTATTRWRRVGDSIHVIGRYVALGAGISVSGELRVFLPTGLSFDTSKISLSSTVGAFELHNAGAYRYGGATLAVDTTQVAFSIRQNAATLGNFAGTGTPEVGWFNAGNDEFSFEFMAPISGWSSNVQLSNDTDTRVVAFRATRTGSQSFPNVPALPGTVVQFDSIKNDTHRAWDSVNYRYIIPVSGYYDISARFLLQFGTSTAEIVAYLVVDGTGVALQQDFKSATTSGNQGVFARFLWNLNAGQAVQVRMYQANSGGGAINGVFETGGIEHGAMYVNRLSGPSVIAATENVIAKYSTTAGQAITSIPATVVYATREIDSHGIVNTTTGDITIPISGKYLIGVYGSTASATWASGQQFLWQIRKNGSFSSFINQIRAQAAYTGILESVGPTYIDCLAGDVINIQAQSSAATTLRTAAGTNFFYLVRLGN